jgi:hypothetical protein
MNQLKFFVIRRKEMEAVSISMFVSSLQQSVQVYKPVVMESK